ncbi:MAG: zinc ABC transporter substrate-binding protein, partial [Chromatiales bacterium]|nr:zinc ABC transporter substrate-binding protein [Chromatiales bacterium]
MLVKSQNWFSVALFLGLLGLASPLFAAPKVVVSIKPIHSLVAGVMEGVAEPELLIRGGQSPHTFSLAPSDARKLSKADMVVWVGERLETPLAKTLQAIADDAKVIELISQPGMQRVAMREGGAWDKHNHDEHDQHEHGEHEPKHDEAEHADAHEDGVDPHLWLSPKNAAQIVRVVSEHLIQVDKA